MSNQFDNIVMSAVKSQEEGRAILENLMAVARPAAVFGEPISSGEYTIIPAAEISVAMGFGGGIGGGTEESEAETTSPTVSENGSGPAGFGGGGGGGGVSRGRPVAVIEVGPNGTRINPVFDVTKISLALFTMLGSMLVMLAKIRRASRQ